MEFDYIGCHCSVNHCKQKDFLPFLCDGCNKKYCLVHRCYKAHGCKMVPKGVQVIICPLCAQGIEIKNDEEADYLWNLHYNSNQCKKINQIKLKCARQGCKNIINDINSINCNICGSLVCLTHRFSDQHKCKNVSNTSSRCLIV